MSHLLFLVLLRTLMGWVCLQRRTDNSIKNHWNISLRKTLDVYSTRNILAIPRLIGLNDLRINRRRLLLSAILI
uniref:HTH myb-type domain-containing protein n=1 Tax=Aegilops tauschii subsp. strangulata TaxID=200361 RepID=A0A452ZH83_AEGTS